MLPLTKSCPHEMGKVAANVMSSRKGNGSELPSAVRCSPSVGLHRQLPRKRWRLWVRCKLGAQCRTPSRSDPFNGVTGGAGGPKGRNRNLPWPPCKKIIKKLIFYLFVSLPQKIRLQRISSSLQEGAFWVALYAKIYELTLRLEQGRLTHCRS